MFGGVADITLRQENQVMLLVLGRQGRARSNDPAALGHNFRAIAHHCHKPLLIGGREQRRIQNILFVHDAGKQAKSSLDWCAKLQRSLPAELTVLTSCENGSGSRLQQQLTESGIRDYRLMSGEELSADSILDAALARQADLIVMSGYRHNALFTKVIGSTLDKVLQQTTLPVLVT